MAKRASVKRWAAAFADFVILLLVWLSLVYLLSATGLALLLLTVALYWGYYFAFDAAIGGTLGKQAAGVTVVGPDMRRAAPWRVAIRACEIFVWAALLGLPFLYVQVHYVREQGRGLGDQLAGTFVVRRRAQREWLAEEQAKAKAPEPGSASPPPSHPPR